MIKTIKALSVISNLRHTRVGKVLAKRGAKLTGVGAAMFGTGVALPDVPDSYMELAKIVLEIIGAITTLVGLFVAGAGTGSTVYNPDTQIKDP